MSFILLRFWVLLYLTTSCPKCYGVTQDKLATSLLLDILNGPIAQDSVLLALDSGAQNMLDINGVLGNRKHAPFPVTLLTMDSPGEFLVHAPVSFLRGSLLTVVMIFTLNPRTLLDYLSGDKRWNPNYLLLFNLNVSINTEELISHEVIQRSEKITLIEEELRNGIPKFFIYTSKPFKSSESGSGKEFKSLKGNMDTNIFLQSKKTLFVERFDNFGGTKLYLGSWCDDFPFLYPKDDECYGSCLDILDIIASKLNFTYDVQMETVDHNWGSFENGTWRGMLGDLIYNDKDLVINNFLITEERIEDFDFTDTYFSEGYGFVLKIPPPLPKWPRLLYPFTALIWISTVCAVVLVAFVMSCCIYFMYETKNPVEVFLLIYGNLVKQQVNFNLPSHWARLIIGCWCLAGIIITTAYTGNLVAFLTVPVYPTRIETVNELAESGLRVCMQDYGSSLPETLEGSVDAALNKLGHNLDLFPYVYLNYTVGFNWVLNNSHALVETYLYLIHVADVHNQTSNTYMMKETVYPGYLTWYLKKNCPYTRIISNTLTRLVESGVVSKLFQNHMVDAFAKPGTSRRDKVSEGKSLSVEELLGAFMLLIIGLGGSFLIFIMEYVVCFVQSKL